MRLLLVFLALAAAGVPAPAPLEIQIVYDNTSNRKDLTSDWGFSALVKLRGRSLLFDTGAKPEIFTANLHRLGIRPESSERVVISHEHPENPTGVYDFFKNARSMLFYFLDNFSMKAYSDAASLHSKAARVSAPSELIPGVYSTGSIAGNPPEQALAIETASGLVVLTSCGHPGAARVVEIAKAQRKKDSVKLLLGGFHTYQQTPQQIAALIAALRTAKVQSIAPAHCTGETATRMMQAAWKSDFRPAGAGARFVID